MGNEQHPQPPMQQQYGTEPMPAYHEPGAFNPEPGAPQPYNAPQQQYREGDNVHNQEWQQNLCNCSPCENCCLGTFLPCMLLGKTSERMRDPSMRAYSLFNTDCLLMCGIMHLTCCGWIYVMIKRKEIRERFGIRGGGCGDCCTTYWCPCCSLIQQDAEVKTRLEAGPNVQGYQPNKEGMTMQPQRHTF